MAAAVTVSVALAQEAEELRAKIARKEDDPAARLAEVEAELERHWEKQHQAREQAEAEYRTALAEYEPLRDAADEAVSALVAAVTAAVEARRKLETARRKAGTSAPPDVSIRASKDRALRELRQDARLAAGASY